MGGGELGGEDVGVWDVGWRGIAGGRGELVVAFELIRVRVGEGRGEEGG